MFEEAVKHVLKHEGGYVNDPVDPGGETNMGISKKAYPFLNIKELTEKDAKDIYFKDYWLKGKCSKLPEELQHIYFDMVVNMGKSRAVKVLQAAICGKGMKIAIDGGIGPRTIQASLKSGLEKDRLRSYRVKYYADLINRKPKLEKYWYGWYRRALAV
jgi:lysozyme family protein|tara:strand:- start:308 stop:781 length:474 start_codon:yes stop_codon:yes gene_type:complete